MRTSRLLCGALSLLAVGACGGSANRASSDAGSTPAHDTGAHDAGTHDASARDATGAHDGGTSPAGDAAADGGKGSLAADACAPCPRDWTQSPAILVVSGVTEFFAVSDVHGDYAAFTKLLVAGKVLASIPATPKAATWAGGTTALVVVGDLIDKGPDAPDVVRLMVALQASAKAAGGQVIVTMGNHEAEFLANPENSKATVSNGLDPELATIGLTPDATAAGDDDIGAFLRELPFAARVDDWFFVHGGNTGGATLGALSTSLTSGVDAMGFGAPVLADATSLLEAKLNPAPPQWWDASGDATTLLTTWTTALGASHLVMGHQPGAVGISGATTTTRAQDQMASEYGGLLFLIDTGLSVGVDDTGGGLLHVTDVGSASVAWEEILPDGSVKSL